MTSRLLNSVFFNLIYLSSTVSQKTVANEPPTNPRQHSSSRFLIHSRQRAGLSATTHVPHRSNKSAHLVLLEGNTPPAISQPAATAAVAANTTAATATAKATTATATATATAKPAK